jgi:hypothetical protein
VPRVRIASSEGSLRRYVLLIAAVLATLAGTWLARVTVALELRATFLALAAAHNPAAMLGPRLTALEPTERLGECLLGLGLLLWVVVGATALRPGRGMAIGAVLVALGVPALTVAFPTVRIPGLLTLRPPSTEWPYGIVTEDKGYWNIYVLISRRHEWAGSLERSDLGPEGLKLALDRRFAPGGPGKRPVRVYVDPRAPSEVRASFTAAVDAAAGPAGVAVDQVDLPDPDNFDALRKLERQRQVEPFHEVLLMSGLAHFAAAIVLALTVWWADARGKRARAATTITGGYLILALSHVLAVPFALYLGMIPTGGAGTSFARIAQNVLPHVGLLFVSAVMSTVGTIAAAIGLVTLPDEPAPGPPRLTPRVRIPRNAEPTPGEAVTPPPTTLPATTSPPTTPASAPGPAVPPAP